MKLSARMRLRIKITIVGIFVAFLINNILYFLPDIYQPTNPSGSGSRLSDIPRQLNYQANNQIIANLRNSRELAGSYLNYIYTLPLLVGIICFISGPSFADVWKDAGRKDSGS